MCRFIDLGALLNITPLHLATALGDVASMKVLLDNGATQLPVCRGVLIDPQVVRPPPVGASHNRCRWGFRCLLMHVLASHHMPPSLHQWLPVADCALPPATGRRDSP